MTSLQYILNMPMQLCNEMCISMYNTGMFIIRVWGLFCQWDLPEIT